MTHEEFARFNLDKAPGAPSPEWRVVMLYYAALHAVNHVIYRGADIDTDRMSHEQRARDISLTPQLRFVERPYRELELLSRVARYQPSRHPLSEARVARADALARQILRTAGLLG